MPEFKDFAGIRSLAGRQVVFWVEDNNENEDAPYLLTGMFKILGATVRIKLGFGDEEAMHEAFAKTMSGETDPVWEAQIKKFDMFGEESIGEDEDCFDIDPEMN